MDMFDLILLLIPLLLTMVAGAFLTLGGYIMLLLLGVL